MITTLQKTALRDGYYYSGYALQHYCVISQDQPKIVCMWDGANECFLFWEFDNNLKRKTKLPFMNDIDMMDEISAGFVPVKEIIPKPEHIIE